MYQGLHVCFGVFGGGALFLTPWITAWYTTCQLGYSGAEGIIFGMITAMIAFLLYCIGYTKTQEWAESENK